MEKRKRIGLALGGGVARGMAHIGVLTVLEGAGIPIDYIAGTSAGAIVGAVYAAGYGRDRAIETAMKMSWRNIARFCWPSDGLVSFALMEYWLVAMLGDLTFSDLVIPFAVVTADIDTGAQVILREGRLAPAVRASCSVPGFVTPAKIDGRNLVDGSLVNTVPVSVVREMGADFVIGVDIFPHAIRPHWGALGFGFAALEILVQNAGGGTHEADCLIAPKLSGKSYLRFTDWQNMFDLGASMALETLPELIQGIYR